MTKHGERLALGPIQNPIRAALQALGAALWALVALDLATRPGVPARGVLELCALSQVALFTASTLYHAVPWHPRWKRRMQRLDHSMIYVKIAGTLTLVAWLSLESPRREVVAAAAWGIALVGVGQKAWADHLHEHLAIPIQVGQAMLGLPALLAFAERFPGAPTALLAAGTCLYAVGALLFVLRRPVLWPRIFSFHEVFHVFVVAGSSAHCALLRHLVA